MSAYELCRQYLDAINRKDLTAVLSLFTANAIAKAPIFGTLHVEEFYARLFSQDKKGIGKIQRVFDSPGTTNALAVQFRYTYVLTSGKAVTFDGMTVFEREGSASKFKSITVFYDASELRRYLSEEQIEGLLLN